MDADSELAKAKFLMIAGLAFLVSCYFVYEEVAYAASGQNATANITEVYLVTKKGRFGQERGKSLLTEFAFNEPDGTRRTGSASYSEDWVPPADLKLPVRYTPGKDGRVRIAGRVNWIGIGFFTVSLCGVLFLGYRLKREADEAYKPRPRRSV